LSSLDLIATHFAPWLVVAGLASVARPARAEPSADEGTTSDDARHRAGERAERSWLYLDEAHVPRPLELVASSSATYTRVGASPTRPFASNVAAPGAALEIGGELGLLPHLSLEAYAVSEPGEDRASWGAMAGARVSILPDASTATGGVVSAGFLRELSGANGAWARATFSHDLDRVRIGTMLHLEHVFAPGRDTLDFMALAGANVKLAPELRAGVEYVGEDLEESLSPEADGGVRHFAGPTASIVLFDDRLTVTGGPAFGLSSLSPRLVGRLTLAMVF
jgi:hypothetical protein